MKCQTKMWRICRNPRCNEWNNEPERFAASYEIIGEKKDNYICRRAGKEYILEKKSFYKTKEECDAAIGNLYGNGKISDEDLEKLWKLFGNIPVNENDEIEEPFIGFAAGTHKEEVWHWFDERYVYGVAVLCGIAKKEDK